MRIKMIMTLIAILKIGQVNGQKVVLNLGDNLPDIVIPKIINNTKSTARTSEYNNQLLIVDFWGTGCQSCIEAMPKLDSLQRKNGDKIKILLVTNEKLHNVEAFWRHNKYVNKLSLPSVVEDEIFNGYFPHKSIPHEVWIYKGKVIAITHSDYVDYNNIKRVLNGEQVNWPLKYDFYSFDQSKPLFTFDDNQIDASVTPVQYAAISDYRDEVKTESGSGGSGIIRNKINRTIRSYFLNQPILNTYLVYWERILGLKKVTPGLGYQPNQVIWEVRDRSKYRYKKGQGYNWDWMINNSICFESLYPDTGQSDKQVFQSIIFDLDRLLGLKVRWEKRKEKVLVIKKSNDNHVIKGKYASEEGLYTVGQLVYNLNQYEDNAYVFDESKDSEVIIPVKISDLKDMKDVRSKLELIGFKLEEQFRAVDHLIFTEINGGKLVDTQMQAQAKMRRAHQRNLSRPTIKDNQLFIEENKSKPGISVTASGLQYKVISKGWGKRPLVGSRVLVQYEGRMVNGKIFDSSYEKGRPTEFIVKEVIKGWSEALQLMSEGAKWELYIPAELAYGTHTASGKIPANSPLIFELELLQVLP